MSMPAADREPRKDQGSASAVVLGVLIVVSLLFAGATLLIAGTIRGVRRLENRQQQRQRLAEVATDVIRKLMSDPTPFADSPVDPVWQDLGQYASEGVQVRLEDLSSRIGLNWVRKEILAEMGVMRAGHSPAELQQLREDTGLHLDLVSAFGEYVDPDALSQLFSPYGYFNVNITDEFVLEKVYAARTADAEAAQVFRTRVQEQRRAKKKLGDEDLAELLAPAEYAVLYPVVSAEPALNIHFAPERVLGAVFAHFQVPLDKLKQIASVRQSAELSREQVSELIGPAYAGTFLDQYLGVRTWFWGITVTSGEAELRWVVARLPREPGKEGTAAFKLLEQAFAR